MLHPGAVPKPEIVHSLEVSDFPTKPFGFAPVSSRSVDDMSLGREGL